MVLSMVVFRVASAVVRVALLLGIAVGCAGCLPDFLQKYRKESQAKEGARHDVQEGPGADLPVGMTGPSGVAAPSPERAVSSQKRGTESGQRATIYALDKQTFRFHLREEEVWNTALDVLLKNYNVNIVERQSGIVTTEWDSYYLANAVYRNKVSMRFRRQTSSVVDVTILNNVERLRDASTAGSGVGAVWLPAADAANEVARIVQNMALALRQPPPVLPPGAAAVQGGALDDPGAPISEFVDKSR